MKRRMISMLLVLCMIVPMLSFQALATGAQNTEASTETGAVQNPFADVKETDWFYQSVMYALQNNIFKGTSDTSFSPEGSMTRAMFVTIMGRIAEINPDDYKGIQEFYDVPADSWYGPYVAWAKEEEITLGVGNDKFDPDGLVTREQMAVLMVRFFDAYKIPYPEATVTSIPADLDSVSDYAKEAVLELWSCGLFQGDGTGNFNPRSNATRAEAAAFSMRFDEIVEKWFVETGKKPAAETKPEENPTEKPEEKPEENPTKKPEEKPEENPTKKPEENNDDDPDSDTVTYRVVFMDRDRRVQSYTVKAGEPLSKTPPDSKTSKDGYIFTGWFSDMEYTKPFYADDPVTSDLTVYAKYEEIVKEELSITSFSLLDQSPNLSFEIQKISDNAGDVYESTVLTVMDGTDPVELDITDNGNATFTVKAKGGFREGSSYRLTLGEGYIFDGKAESVRTANFNIEKDEVYNLVLNDDIIYIQDTDEISYKIGSNDPVDVLRPELLNSETSEKITGTFDYDSAGSLNANDILCIYENTPPYERDYVNNNYTGDAEAYVEVVKVEGNAVTFRSLDESDAEKIIFMPDTIPFKVAELPNGEAGTVQATEVDNEARVAMNLNEDPEVEKGDFLVFYTGEFANLTKESEVYYGVVTKVEGDTIYYNRTTKEEIEQTMDTFLQQTPEGDQLLEEVDTQALIEKIERQVRDSGFAEEAAIYLAHMSTQTDGFKTLSGLTDFSVTDENGAPLSSEKLQLMGIGKSIELSDDVEVKVELDRSSKYFDKGIRLAVGIEAEFTVDIGDEGELKIVLSAVFAEEISIDITARAHADVTWIIIVPKFNELTFRTSIDIKNYSAISVDVKMYTVEKEEDSLWKKLKGIKNGKYKETIEQIEEIKDKITEAKETAEKIRGYKEDLENLWAAIPSDVTNKNEYEGLLDTLGELNATQELMELLDLTSETELDAGVRNLMERYSEMLENESDWIEILNKEIFKTNFYISVFAIRISADFVIKANVNIVMGANMEYVIGKRYSFWFDIISKNSGSSEMDLLDEKFAFQFYVMGQLGLKMGVEAEIAVGVISTKIGSIGLTAEFGPYVETWGYFIYEYTRLRPANTTTWNYDERIMGALYLEFGMYLEMTFKAQAFNDLFKYEPTLLDKKWPLLTAGERNNVYDFAYEIAENEVLLVRDHDNNSANGITMILPEVYRQMEYIDLCEGDIEQTIYDLNKFNYTLSNSNFAFNKDTGEISVTIPEGVQYIKGDLTLTWKSDKLAFSHYDIKVTIPLVWTNLSTEELKERFTASVRAGNVKDGYSTIWSQRVIKNSQFDLPAEDEIKAILGVDSYESAYGNLKYSAINGYEDQQTEGLTILRDTAYYFDITPRTYSLTVKDVEKPDGTKGNRQFTAKFGEAFDLSSLAETGTIDDEKKNYTAFLKVVAKDSGDKEILRDVNEPIGRAFAMDILDGATFTAAYVDHSATVTFKFEGIDLEPIEVKMRKGDVASSEFFYEELNAMNAIVKSIYPVFAPISGPTTYIVVCEEQEAPLVNRIITYNTNGGSEISQVSYPVGSAIGKPADPVKPGYYFEGWYSDSELTQPFDFTILMPDADITLHAKWRGKEYTVTFDANEGILPEGEETQTVIFGQKYGDLPTPSRTGYYFKGWFTERTEGQQITRDTVVVISNAHILYAQWGGKPSINEEMIEFNQDLKYDYNGQHQPAVYEAVYQAVYGSGFDIISFTIQYKRQVLDNEWLDTAVNAGVYDVKITKAEDENYDYFEKLYENVMTINKINRTIDDAKAGLAGSSYKANLLAGKLHKDSYPGDGTVMYAVSTSETVPTSGWQDSRVFMNLKAGDYYIFARVSEGENYFETSNAVRSTSTVKVEGLPERETLDYNYELYIETSDINNAGTNSKISGRLHFLDGTASALTHFDNSGDDFERGSWGFYGFDGPIYHAPWMIQAVELVYEKSGIAAGWHCDNVMPFAVLSALYNLQFKKLYVGGDEIPVERWFEDKKVVWKGNAAAMERRITDVGNFGDIIDDLILSSGETEKYTFTYDGLVIDQYANIFDRTTGNFVTSPYNAYDWEDAPTLSITAEDEAYSDCLDYTVNSFSIDKEALYAAMKAKGDTEITLTVTLSFPERSASTGEDPYLGKWYNTWTETITVTIDD